MLLKGLILNTYLEHLVRSIYTAARKIIIELEVNTKVAIITETEN